MPSTINPFYTARRTQASIPHANCCTARLCEPPVAPRNSSPVPHLTSLYHFDRAGEYGNRGYPGNCGGNLIKDLLRFYKARSVFDPMTGSGTCRDVCGEMGSTAIQAT